MNHKEDALDLALADLYAEGTSLRFEKNWREAVRREEQTRMKQNRKNIWKKTVLPIAAALVLVLGASWAGQMEGEWSSSSESAVTAPKEARSSKTSYDTVSYSYSAGTSGAALTSTAASKDSAANYSVAESASYDMSADTGAGAAENSIELTDEDSRKLIRTVDLSLRSENFDQDVAGIQQLLAQYGGYIENLYQQGEAGSYYGRSVSLTMRVPSQHLDAFLTGLDGFGRVTSRSETTEDMTEQYSDNEVRIQTLRTKLERLNTLLTQAEDVSDILEIESEIADTQYELERYETRQLNIDRRVDMSYVYVNVQESVVKDDMDDEELSLGQRLKAALKASIEGLGRFGRNLLVFLVMVSPVILLVVVALLVIWLVRRSRKGKKDAAAQPDEIDRGEMDEEPEDGLTE